MSISSDGFHSDYSMVQLFVHIVYHTLYIPLCVIMVYLIFFALNFIHFWIFYTHKYDLCIQEGT